MFKLCMLVVGSTMVMLAGVEALTFQDQYDVWAADLVSTQNKAQERPSVHFLPSWEKFSRCQYTYYKGFGYIKCVYSFAFLKLLNIIYYFTALYNARDRKLRNRTLFQERHFG